MIYIMCLDVCKIFITTDQNTYLTYDKPQEELLRDLVLMEEVWLVDH